MLTAPHTARAWRLSPLIVTAWLTACATAPSAPPVAHTCPIPPALELDLPPAPAQGYTEMMRKFLSGSLPTLTDYALPSSDVRLPTMR
ncbi:hypothetical protein [Tepidimonas charontis]|uniref:Lipoprotein n=1 Tax=Tepidimonas charontis TaxID=2267262 RepID=A0A554XFU6_9BURK|nr:hypothetical protein [Tepidimonas charontis]TSE34711.1 hypothetical protein Tchar_01215 [Tepidimonas charontis]